MTAQHNTLVSIQRILYYQTFEFFPFDESIFRDKLAKELKSYEYYKSLLVTATPRCDIRIASKMISPFITIQLRIEAERHKYHGMEFEISK